MAESDGDIEFLDEDADIVQQCVQAVPVLPVPEVQVPEIVKEKPITTPLLVERLPAERKRKRRKDEEDSDYDPNDDFVPQSPPPSKGKKKRQQAAKKVKTNRIEVVRNLRSAQSIKAVQSVKAVQSPKAVQISKAAAPTPVKKKYIPVKEVVLDRKLCNIRIPDYDDPLCLPVKAIQYEDSDIKRMKNWNNVCLEHFKHCDNLLKPERGDTYSSSRNVVFRNVVNKSGIKETTIWSKTSVENEEGDKKSEIFQCVLPRYKEKKVLTTFSLTARKTKPYHVADEVILSKEDSKDGEILVVYKPREAASSVYKLVAPQDGRKTKEEPEDKEDFDDDKMYMKETVYAKMCAPCFQTSWRGVKKNTRKSIACPICTRSFVTVYNLLAHFKTHSSEDMQKYKKVISSILAEIVDYHYKCRICREQFASIKTLRQHLSTHQGNELFTCEIGNHMAR